MLTKLNVWLMVRPIISFLSYSAYEIYLIYFQYRPIIYLFRINILNI